MLVIDWMLTIGLIAASRVAWRILREGQTALGASSGPLRRVLIAGAGRAGVSVAKDLMATRWQDVEVVGFVDDDPEKQDSTLLGRPILGTTRDVAEIRRCRPIDQVIVAMPSAPPRVLRSIAERASSVGDVRVVPPLESLLRGQDRHPALALGARGHLPGRHAVDLAAAE